MQVQAISRIQLNIQKPVNIKNNVAHSDFQNKNISAHSNFALLLYS